MSNIVKLHFGISVPAAASPYTVADGVWQSVAIPAGACGVRIRTDVELAVEHDQVIGNPATVGASIPPGSCHRLEFWDCQYLHLAAVGAEATVGLSWLYPAVINE